MKGVSVMKKKNTNSSGLWTASYGEIGATLKSLEDRNITVKHLARLRADPEFADRVAKFMLRGGVEDSIHQKIVRDIMGKNFFGVEEWSTLYGVSFTERQLRAIAEFPWSEDILNAPCPFRKGESIRKTHFAFLGLDVIKDKPLSILRWHRLHPKSGQPHFALYATDAWYLNQEFAEKSTCGFRWYLMPLNVILYSNYKTYQKQLLMLPTEYEVPLAIEQVTKLILYYRKKGLYLYPQMLGRCRDVVPNSLGDRHILVGNGFNFGDDGIHIAYYPDDISSYDIGLAVSRKL